MNRIDEYKDKINWDIVWEKAPEELPHENPNIPIKDHIIKKV